MVWEAVVLGVEDRPGDGVHAWRFKRGQDTPEELSTVCSSEAAHLLEHEEGRTPSEDHRDRLPDQQALAIRGVGTKPQACR